MVTLIAVAAAALIAFQPGSAPVRQLDQPAFPELRADPDAVAKVILTTNAGSVTLLREVADRWVTLERFGHAVDAAKVRELIVTLADMRLIEAKTSQPERYPRLELEDPGSEGANSRLLRLETADGSLLAEMIIGKQRPRATGTQASGTYLRRPGEDQSWLASGGLGLDQNVVDWLDDQIVDLDGARLRRIEVRPVDGEAYAIERAAPGGPLALAGLAAGETATEASLDRLANALSSLRLEDVRPRADLAWPEAHPTATFTTFDGLELTVELATIDATNWLRIDARAVAPTAPTAATAEPAPAPEPGAGEGESEVETAAEPPVDAASLDQRLGRWAYQVPAWVHDRLTTPRAALLEGG